MAAMDSHDADRSLISVLVVAHDEQADLPDCLAGLAFCDELVVVRDRCSNGSKKAAEAAGARLVESA